HQVGQFIVDFIREYNEVPIAAEKPDKQDKEEKTEKAEKPEKPERPESREPWRFHAARLRRALEEFQTQLTDKRHPSREYVVALLRQVDPLLKEMVETKTKPSPTALNAWLEQNPPKNKTLYKGMPEAAIRPPERV